MALTFPGDRFVYDFDTGTVRFMATDGIADAIICTVSEEALADFEGTDAAGAEVVPIFLRHRYLIQGAAERNFALGGLQNRGTVSVTLADLRHQGERQAKP